MTLILAATCQDGIAVCSDKRRRVTTPQGITDTDDLYKLYYFKTIDVLAYNHGINRIRGRDWDCCLRDFESAHIDTGMRFDELVDTFSSYIGGSVEDELVANQCDDCVGFVFCGITYGAQPVARELFWTKNVSLEDIRHRGLIRSGLGARYLNDHLERTPTLNTVEYWSQLAVEKGLSELTQLFGKASEERRRQGGQEFSDSCDTGILKSSQQAGFDR